MLKSILNLEGVQELRKNEQKAINGGFQELCQFIPDVCNSPSSHLCEDFCNDGGVGRE